MVTRKGVWRGQVILEYSTFSRIGANNPDGILVSKSLLSGRREEFQEGR